MLTWYSMIIPLILVIRQLLYTMKRYLLLFFGSLAFTFLIFLPWSLNITNALTNVIDPLFYAWNISHNTQAILAGGKNLLNTNIFFPEPNTLAFSDTLFTQTLFTAPIIMLTNNPILAENIYLLFTFPLAVISMYALVSYLVKNHIAAVCAGIFYAFSYPRLSQIGHMPALSSQWLPLIILFLLKFLSDGNIRNLILAFVFYFLSLNCTVYFGVFVIPFGALIIVAYAYHWIRKKKIPLLTDRVKKILLFTLPFCILIGISLYPYIRLKAEIPGIKRGIEDTQYLKAKPIDYLTVLPTSLTARLAFPQAINEHVLFPTFTLLILACLSFYRPTKRSKNSIVLFCLISVIAFLLSLGIDQEVSLFGYSYKITLPYFYLYYLFPPLQIVRVPARFAIFVILGLSVLAGISIQKLYSSKYKFLIPIFLLLFLIEIAQTGTPSVTVATYDAVPPVYEWLKHELPTTIIAELPLKRLEKGILMEEQLMLPYTKLKEYDVYAMETYRTYFSGFHQKRMINGYSGFFPTVYHDNAKYLETFPNDDAMYALTTRNVRYIIIHAWQYTNTAWQQVEENIQLYKNIKFVRQFGDDYVYEIVKPL